MKSKTIRLTCTLSALLTLAEVACAQGTAFTYQGRLMANGAAANGSNDLTFTLYDAASGGATVGVSNMISDLAVTNGLFTVALDFGAAFDGNARWLQIAVRPGASAGAYTNLVPRQSITSTPYALRALSAGSANTATSVAAGGVNNLALASDAVDGAKILNGSITSADLNSSLLNGTFWNLGGNADANPTNGAFLGTRDNLPLELMVYSERVLRLEPHFISPNVLAGHRRNAVSNGGFGATIAGGGSSDYPNRIAGEYAAVLGGYGNTANGRASTAMGFNTTAGGHFSTAAGADARASGNSSVAMGNSTTASGAYASAMGNGNTASGESSTALGWGTAASALGATALGVATEASGERSTASGFLSVASGFCATALGRASTAGAEYCFAAGYRAKAMHPGSFVWADSLGNDFASTTDNQFLIRASGGIGIGTPSPQGSLHIYSANNPTTMRLQSSGTPGFGRIEFVSDPQGSGSEWRPGYIQSTDNGGFAGGLSFVVNGSGFANRFAEVEVMRVVNGAVGIGTATPASALQVIGTVTATAFNPPSDRNLKENFEAVNSRDVLDKVAALPISRWNFKGDAATPHVGPMAQDFHAAFGLGTDDKHIATVDADGVALAAIQGLNQRLSELQAELKRRDTENSELKQRFEALERVILGSR